jgi:hypothetical protein
MVVVSLLFVKALLPLSLQLLSRIACIAVVLIAQDGCTTGRWVS